mgnify:CR=1 FL=1
MKNRFGKISLYKFLFSIMIIVFHVGNVLDYNKFKFNFGSGSIAVDFFFVVSGFFFCRKYVNYKVKNSVGEDSFNYFINRTNRFIKYIIILLIIAIPFSIFCLEFNFTSLINAFYKLLYIPHHTKCGSEIFGITWYIVAMILVESMLFPFLIKYKKEFVYIISPIIIILLGSYLLIRYGHFATPWKMGTILYKGILRSIFEINIGMYLYLISEKISNVKFTKLSKILLLLFEIAGYLSIFVLVNLNNAHRRFDVLMLIIISICILISTNKNMYLYNFCNNKLFYFLEKLSLPMYIYQWLIIEIMVFVLTKFNIHLSYLCFSGITIIISIIFGIVVLKLIELYDNNKEKIKSLFIAN